ncbi:UNVERIFIED_CONTAM: uncharacterized protein YutE (UPF0331/DUF86 family) [Jeotgalibacillus campisalis]
MDVADYDDVRMPSLPTLFRQLEKRGLISPDQYVELDALRQLRNRVFHGRAGEVEPKLLLDASALLRELTNAIQDKAGEH